MKKQFLILIFILIVQSITLVNFNQEGTTDEMLTEIQINKDDFNDNENKQDLVNYDNYVNEELKSDNLLPIHENDQKLSKITSTASNISFISRWNTSKLSTGSSNTSQIKLPLVFFDEIYNFTVNWGDSTSDVITMYNQTEVTHNYESEGEYTLVINGTLKGWNFFDVGDKLKIIEISQWGVLRLGNSGGYFKGCENLELTAIDALDLSGTTSLVRAFSNCKNLGSNGNMNLWNVSSVTTMHEMFYYATSFNQPIGDWNVSSVIDMEEMFYRVTSFNQSIGNWDVSSVTNMNDMFFSASLFNQSIGDWDVSCVTTMDGMFREAYSFNQPIANWDVSCITTMYMMFSGASSFNQPIGNWNVSSVTDMSTMFYYASSFNQSIANWNVSSVTTMNWMFSSASSFNQPIGNWNVSSVTTMNRMFYGTALSIPNYDHLLLGWEKLPLQSGVDFHAGSSSHYSSAAANARSYIITTFNWTITDGGPQPIPPSSPQSLQAIASNNYIKLSWSPPTSDGGSAIINYKLYRSITSGSGYVLLISAWANLIEYFDTSVTDGQLYYYIVKAVNSAGESKASNEASATPICAPSAPQSLQTIVGDNLVNLSWSFPISDGGAIITGFKIYRSATSGSGYVLLANIDYTMDYIDKTVSNGQLYYYIVKAVNSAGESEASNEASATPFCVPSAPQSLQANTEENLVNLSWSASVSDGGSTITGYKIYRSTTSGSGYVLLATVNGYTVGYIDIAVSTGQLYYYIVKAVNSAGESEASNEVVVTPEEGNSIDFNYTSGFEIYSLIAGFLIIFVRSLIKNRNMRG